MNAAGFYLLSLALFILTSILNANFLAQTISEMNGGGTAPPVPYTGNVVSAAVGLVYIITCTLNMIFLARLVSDNYRSLEK